MTSTGDDDARVDDEQPGWPNRAPAAPLETGGPVEPGAPRDDGDGGTGPAAADAPGWDADDEDVPQAVRPHGPPPAMVNDFGYASIRGGIAYGDRYSAEGDIVNNHNHNHNHYQVTAAHRSLAAGPVPPSTIDQRRRAPRAEGRTEPDLRRRLRATGVQVLRGRPGTGRRTAVLLALAGDGLDVEVLDVTGRISDLADHDYERRGYLAHFPGPADEPVGEGLLAQLRHRVERASAWLVVVTDEDTASEWRLPEEYVVDYHPPENRDVFWAHLHAATTPELASRARAYFQEPAPAGALAYRLGQAEDFDEVVGVAAEIRRAAQRGFGDGGPTDPLPVQLRAATRERVRAWLVDGRSPTGERPAPDAPVPRPPSLWDKAFLLAVAVLEGFPLNRTLAAADQLVQRLWAVQSPGAAPPSRPVFHGSLQACAPWLRVTEHQPGRIGLPGKGRTRRVWLRDRHLAPLVLDVAWRDFEAIHQPLALWLRDLASGRSGLVRARAADAVGVIATLDFEHAARLILTPWASAHDARSPQSAAWRRQAAARALATASALDDRTAPDVRQLLRDWTRADAPRPRHHTALLAWEAGLSPQCATAAPASLAPALRACCEGGPHLAAPALEALLEAGQAGPVLRTLDRWAAKGGPAVPTLFLLLDGLHDPMGARAYSFLAAAGGVPADRAALVNLLTGAFADQQAARKAWPLLRRWVELAEAQPTLLAALARVVADLTGTTPYLRRRLRFLLGLWAHRSSPPLPAATTLLGRINPA